MVKILLAQYADHLLSLVFLHYEDDNTEIVPKSHPHVTSFVQNGGYIEPFQPLMPGGVVPAGTIGWFASDRPPGGYLVCDGSELSRARFYRLFSVIGTTFGEGDGQTTFNLPNLGGRCVRGWAQGTTLDPDRSFGSTQGDAPKQHSHGIEPTTHTHTIADPGHIHGVNDPGHVHPITDPGHFHSITDPGHKHKFSKISHMGYVAQFIIYEGGSIRIPPDETFFFYSHYYQSTFTATPQVKIANAKANLFLANAKSNVSTESAVTNISINTAGVDIPYTEYEGGTETRPENVALLPMIRY